jgi:hypothetical protein
MGVIPTGGQLLQARWTGITNFVGTTLRFEVTVNWTLTANSDYVDGSLRFRITQPGGTLPFHLSQVHFPVLDLQEIDHAQPTDPTDQLLVPFISGAMLANPLEVQTWSSVVANDLPGAIPVTAYYGEGSGRCLILGDNDELGHWRWFEVDRFDDGSGNTLRMRAEHYPDDVFNNKDYTLPYESRIWAIEGDWVDVARTYRDHMRDSFGWYHGAVADAAHPMPSELKALVGHATLQPAYGADHMDNSVRDLMRVTRVFGDAPFYAMWYGGHFPDEFDKFYFKGYLPGRPSFAASCREGQKQFGHIAAPYINGSGAVDYTLADPVLHPQILNPTSLMLNIHSSIIVAESLLSATGSGFADAPVALMCNAASGWDGDLDLGGTFEGEFVKNAVEIIDHSQCRGIYLDVFGGSICYATDHNHLPGGGSYLTANRMDQVARIKAQVAALAEPPDFFCVSMESVLGRWSEQVHYMHIDPLRNAFPFNPLQGPSQEIIDNSVTVPFFRHVHDNVKIGKIAGAPSNDSGRASWVMANDVFTFGQLASVLGGNTEVSPVLGNRPLGAHYLFAGKITRFLKNSFMDFHNGTAERIPDNFDVQDVPGFLGAYGALPGDTDLFMEHELTPGMFRAVNGKHAFVVANPWVGPDQADFTITATFLPADYSDFPLKASGDYQVTFYDDDGSVTGPILVQAGASYPIGEILAPGEIVYWVFEAL